MLNRIKSEPALVSGAVQAVLGLLLAFGVKLSTEQTGAVLALTAAGLALFVRSKVTPTAGDPGEGGSWTPDLSLIVGFIGGLFLGFLLWHR